MYIESQEKDHLGVAMQELSDMNPLPMNTMLDRQSKEKAIAKRTERKGKTVKDVPPTTAGNLNKIQKESFNPESWSVILLSLFFSSQMKKIMLYNECHKKMGWILQCDYSNWAT